MNWFWMNIPAALVFLGLWTGIPMWLILKHPDRGTPLTVPLHRELKRGTLAGILTDAGVDADRLRELL